MQDDKSIIFTLVGNNIFTAEFQCKIIAIVMLVIPDRDYKYFWYLLITLFSGVLGHFLFNSIFVDFFFCSTTFLWF